MQLLRAIFELFCSKQQHDFLQKSAALINLAALGLSNHGQ